MGTIENYHPKDSEALEIVNELRTAWGYDPLEALLPGTHSSGACPVARSLEEGTDLFVVTYAVRSTIRSKAEGTLSDSVLNWVHPTALALWIRDFDNGQHPEYERGRNECRHQAPTA